MGGEARAKTRRAFLSYIFFLTTVFVLEILILRVGACVWPWLPERVVVVHIPCVLSYLLLIYTYTVCRSGSSLYIYRVYYYLLLTTYYLPVLIAPPHVGANTHT